MGISQAIVAVKRVLSPRKSLILVYLLTQSLARNNAREVWRWHRGQDGFSAFAAGVSYYLLGKDVVGAFPRQPWMCYQFCLLIYL